LWPPQALDGERNLLLGGGAVVWFRPELHRICDSARALRYRHGRRVGCGRFAGNGKLAQSLAWCSFRGAAGWIQHRVAVWCFGGAFRPARLGMASDVLGRRGTRSVGLLHPAECSGIASVETTS